MEDKVVTKIMDLPILDANTNWGLVVKNFYSKEFAKKGIPEQFTIWQYYEH